MQLINPEPVQIDEVDEGLHVVAREVPHGGHLVAMSQSGGEGPRILIFGHMDTVFELNHPFQDLERREGRLYGPGVIDAKGGIVVLLMALDGLKREGLLEGINLAIVLNGDEEISSRSSRTLFERWAGSVDYALGLEPGRLREDGVSTIVKERKGIGFYRVYVRGKAAHAGSSHHLGINAFEELAYKTIHIQQLTDATTGVTVNVGGEVVIRDSKRNAIPYWAEAEIDVRFQSMPDGEALETKLREIVAHSYVENASLQASTQAVMLGGVVRPPWPPTDESALLADAYCQVARELGREVVSELRGGGSDGNFLADVGVPTVDGLGAVGSGSHTAREYAVADSFSQRAEQLAVFLVRLSQSRAGMEDPALPAEPLAEPSNQ